MAKSSILDNIEADLKEEFKLRQRKAEEAYQASDPIMRKHWLTSSLGVEVAIRIVRDHRAGKEIPADIH